MQEETKIQELQTENDENFLTEEFRFDILVDEYRIYGECIIEGLKVWCQAKNLTLTEPDCNSVRVELDDGWFKLRISMFDAVMIYKIGSENKENILKIAQEMSEFFYNCQYLCTDALVLYLSQNNTNEDNT